MRATGVALAILVAAMTTPADLQACQCGKKPSTREATATSDVVFAGTVTSLRPLLARVSESPAVDRRPNQDVEFKVLRAWQGIGSSDFKIKLAQNSCTFSFTSGQTYLVFARRENPESPEFFVSICTPTKLLSTAQADLKELGPSKTFSVSEPYRRITTPSASGVCHSDAVFSSLARARETFSMI